MTWKNIYQKEPGTPPPKKEDVIISILKLISQRTKEPLSAHQLKFCDYDYYATRLQSPHDFRRAIHDEYERSNSSNVELILKLMPNEFFDEMYTRYLDSMIHNYFYCGDLRLTGYSVGKIGSTELMIYYHPEEEIKIAGMNVLLAHDIGNGSAHQDIGLTLCLQSNCYLEPENPDFYYDDTKWRRVIDPHCIVHGNYIFSTEDRKNVLHKWEETVAKYM